MNCNKFIKTPFSLGDAYKLSHWCQYPKGTTGVYSNLTPRKSRRIGIDQFVFFGLQYWLKDLDDQFKENFFELSEEEAVANFDSFFTNFFGFSSPASNKEVRGLHKLGYLPVKIKALKEGSVIDHNIPPITFRSTHKDFFWFSQWLETWCSTTIWKPATSATTALYYRRIFEFYNKKTSDIDWIVDFQAHDFSMRGMSGVEDACASGAGHLLSFKGTDTCPTNDWVNYYYPGEDNGLVGTSVPATEHTIQTAFLPENTNDTDMCDFLYTENTLKKYPTGIISQVCDGYDFWRFVEFILPKFRDAIMLRDGKFVIRPDSSPQTPVEIIVGEDIPTLHIEGDFTVDKLVASAMDAWKKDMLLFGGSGSINTKKCRCKGKYYFLEFTFNMQNPVCTKCEEIELTYEQKGLVECLYEIFGGTVNSKGYIDLDPHIGAIYGDSITLEYAEKILSGLKQKGFSSNNIVLGVGSFTYQFVTRDTHGIAIKSTAVEADGHWRATYKDPKTDNSGKKSAKGFLSVDFVDGKYVLNQNVSEAEEAEGCLELVYLDGVTHRKQSFNEVRSELGKFI